MGKYSDRQRAEALAVFDSCGNVRETERITGIPDSTIKDWVDGTHGVNEDTPILRAEKKIQLSEKLDAIAHQCAGLLPGMLPSANVREVVGAMGQSIEKSLLLRGQSTDINKVLERLILKLKADLPDVDESDLRTFAAESLQISELAQ